MKEKRKAIQDAVDKTLKMFRECGVPVVIVWTGDGGRTMDISSNAEPVDSVKMIDYVSGCMKAEILQPPKPELVQ